MTNKNYYPIFNCMNDLFRFMINQLVYLEGCLSMLHVESEQGNHIDSKTIEHVQKFVHSTKTDLLQAKRYLNDNNNNKENTDESLHTETVLE